MMRSISVKAQKKNDGHMPENEARTQEKKGKKNRRAVKANRGGTPSSGTIRKNCCRKKGSVVNMRVRGLASCEKGERGRSNPAMTWTANPMEKHGGLKFGPVNPERMMKRKKEEKKCCPREGEVPISNENVQTLTSKSLNDKRRKVRKTSTKQVVMAKRGFNLTPGGKKRERGSNGMKCHTRSIHVRREEGIKFKR